MKNVEKPAELRGDAEVDEGPFGFMVWGLRFRV